MKERLILASASSQRKILLEGLGFQFQVVPSDIAEQSCGETHPRRRAQVLAEMKAQDVAGKHPGTWVIGCDTLVVAEDGTLLEKPEDEHHARHMLELQSGRVSVVHSGLALIAPDSRQCSDVSSSSVSFKELTSREMDWWIGTGQWRDRSGGFQIDGRGQLMIAKVEGDWTGVVGLPLFLLGELMRRARAPFIAV
ncbi:MAG: septum formation protein [Candidatus Peregrinibacteria bacterium Greene0416_19]|nr:MAG: septum formation protein [Candidatus Peregrinibacteria bacterium Greene0416_19]